MRETTKLKIVHPEPRAAESENGSDEMPSLFDDDLVIDEPETRTTISLSNR